MKTSPKISARPCVHQSDAWDVCLSDFFESLSTAMEKAGGSPSFITSHKDTITLVELARLLASNGIRFVHDPKRTITNVKEITKTETTFGFLAD
jgi:hypothetical protein